MVKSFLENLVILLASFLKSYPKQLFCRESTSAFFYKKGTLYQTLSQEFSELAGLQFTKKELHYRALPGIFAKFPKPLKKVWLEVHF